MTSKTKGTGTFVKYLLFLFNSAFALFGAAMLMFAAWALADEASLRPLIKTRVFSSLALAALGIAILTLLTALLGCFGAIKEIKCMVVVFSALLLFFLVATLGGVVTLYMFRHTVGKELETALINSIKNDYKSHPVTPEARAIKDSWDWLQSTLRCCGVRHNASASYYIWQRSNWFKNASNSSSSSNSSNSSNTTNGIPLVPYSCCVPKGPGVVVDPNDDSSFLNRDQCLGIGDWADIRGPPKSRIAQGVLSSNDALYLSGCWDSFEALLKDETNLVVVVAFVVALILVEVVGLGMACHLCRRLKSYRKMQLGGTLPYD